MHWTKSFFLSLIAKVHEGTKKAFECSQCDASFSNGQLLKGHVRGVHEKLKMFACSVCNSKFTKRSNLVRHALSVHEGIKPYECEVCHEMYESKGYVQKHIESVHKKMRPHICVMCGASFGQKSHLYKHALEKHDLKTKDYKEYSNNPHISLDGHPNIGEIKGEEEQERTLEEVGRHFLGFHSMFQNF